MSKDVKNGARDNSVVGTGGGGCVSSKSESLGGYDEQRVIAPLWTCKLEGGKWQQKYYQYGGSDILQEKVLMI